ncbi:MAG: ATP-binding protein [Syntrophobacteraceae bacterium]
MKSDEPGREHEELIERCLRALHEKDRLSLVGSLVQGFVHNTNGPLQNLSMLTEMLLTGMDIQDRLFKANAGENPQWSEITDKQRRRLTQLRDQIYKMGADLREFMQLHEIERSGTDIDINALLTRITHIFRSDLFFKHRVQHELRLTQNLPQVRIPGRNIIPVLFHIYQNAITAMLDSPRKELIVETSIQGGNIAIRITDSGRGLGGRPDPESLFRLFESRWPPQSEDPKKTHLGFGLYAARELLAPHGGSIDLECGDESTTAVIRIPIPEKRA